MDYDASTGRLLTNSSWTYATPLASDIPEKFTVELVDLTKQRLQSPIVSCMRGILGPILGCIAVPWKPAKMSPVFESSRAIGKTPVLLCTAIKSALHAAMVAGTGSPLPDNNL